MPVITRKNISLSKWRYVLVAYELRGISRAAEQLGRSQTAVTKAVQEIEAAIGFKLFDRSHSGATATAYGKAIARRIGYARDELLSAGDIYLQQGGKHQDISRIPIFNMTLSDQRLNAFIRCCDYESIGTAAAALNITPMAVKRSLTDIERSLGLPLFESQSAGLLRPLPLAREIARAIQVAFAEIDIGTDEVASIDGAARGQVRVGTIPSARTVLNARTIIRFHQLHQDIRVRTFDSTIERCELALRSGDIDMIAGPFFKAEGDDLIAEPLMEVQACLLARSGHPAVGSGVMQREDLARLTWALPPPHVPLRKAFDKFLSSAGIADLDSYIETGSGSTIRSLLINSDFVAVAPMHEFYDEIVAGHLSLLPLHPTLVTSLADLKWQSYILHRRRSPLSPAARIYLEELRNTASEISNSLAAWLGSKIPPMITT